MPPKLRSNLPAYQRIQGAIRKRIDSGHLRPGDPFALELCYLSQKEFPVLLAAPPGRKSLFAVLERNYNVKLGYADEEVDATAADPEIAALLGIPRRDPLLRIRQVIFSSGGK